jgi:hypothetical protein
MSIRGAKKDFKPGQKASRFQKVVSPAKDPRQPAAPVTDAEASQLIPVTIGAVVSVTRRRV